MASIVISGSGGRLALPTLADCPDFTFTKSSPGGDQNASLNIPFARGMPLPKADSFFTIEEDGAPIWDGFTGPLDVPELSQCSGNATIGALGWGLSFLKRGENPLIYGPQWQSGLVVGSPDFAIEGAVMDAVARLAPNVIVLPENVVTTGVTIQQTPSFLGQTGADILNSLAALTQYLATPALWHVRQRLFFWRTLDLAPKYRVLMANGAKVKPKYDPSRVVNRVIVGWGNTSLGQTATWPEAISYTKRGQIVDLYLNAGAEVRDYQTALTLAQGVYARMLLLSPEWSFDVTIPPACLIEMIVDGAWVPVPTIRMEPGYFLSIPDLDQGALGPELEVPQGGFVTHLSWQNTVSTMSVSIGEPRQVGALARLARRITATGVSPINLSSYSGRDFSVPLRSASGVVGPQLATAVPSNTPPPVDFKTPAVSTQYQTVLPEVTPPQPPANGYQVNSADSIGVKGVVPIEPCVLEKYSLIASQACTVTLKVTRVSDGAVVLNEAKLVGETKRLEIVLAPEYAIVKPDHLEIAVTVADPAMVAGEQWVSVTWRSRRLYPGYPGNTAPKTGKQF